MRYLLDSHVVIWSLDDSSRLSSKVKSIFSSEAEIYISIASLWEIAIKHNMGKLELPNDFHEVIAASNIKLLPVSVEHIEMLASLDSWHRDPFDRMIVAQAKHEKLILITDDKILLKYGIKTVNT